MKYDMTKPCAKCPFVRGTQMRLRPDRIRDIERSVNQHNGATFPCHETLDYSDGDGGRDTDKTTHCAGALIYIEKQGVSSQMMRIAERLGMYDRRKLADEGLVWDDVDEWVEHGSCA
jgi:hypothetical protein